MEQRSVVQDEMRRRLGPARIRYSWAPVPPRAPGQTFLTQARDTCPLVFLHLCQADGQLCQGIPATPHVGRQLPRGRGARGCSIPREGTGRSHRGRDDSHGSRERCPTAPQEESLTREPWGPPVPGEFRTQLFVCTASAGIDRLFRSLRNIPLLLGCSWENLVQHMQAVNMISEKNQTTSQKKPNQNKPKDKTQPQLTPVVLGSGKHKC